MAQDTGPLDWRIGIVDKSGRPTQEFMRKWQTQRANNALIGQIEFGTGAPTGTPEDGAEYVDTTAPATLYVGHSGNWVRIGVISANPTATASDTVVDGTASTFMRSDAAPAIQKASSSQFGLVKVDGTTITSSGGVISSTSGGGGGHGYEAFGGVPTGSGFTPHNHVATSLTQGTTSLVISWGAAGGNNLETFVQTAPSTPYDVYGRFRFVLPATNHQTGICLRNSTSGKVMVSGFNSGTSITNQEWTSETSFSTSLTTVTIGETTNGSGWLRFNNDGTTITYYYSLDGLIWRTISTRPLSSFLITADQIGFYATPAGAAGVSYIGSFGTLAPS